MKSAIRLKHIPILLATLALFTPALGFANAKAMTPDPAHTRVRFRSGLHRAAVAIAQYASGNYAAKGAHPVDLMQHFPLALRPAALAAFALCTSPELFETWQPKFHSLSDPEGFFFLWLRSVSYTSGRSVWGHAQSGMVHWEHLPPWLWPPLLMNMTRMGAGPGQFINNGVPTWLHRKCSARQRR